MQKQIETQTYYYLADKEQMILNWAGYMDWKCLCCCPDIIGEEQMTNEMVEKVARALCKSNHNQPD